VLELTEHVPIEDLQRRRGALSQFREPGIRWPSMTPVPAYGGFRTCSGCSPPHQLDISADP